MYEEFRNRVLKHGSYAGEIMRNKSNLVVNATWMNSVSTRPVCVKAIDHGLPPTYESVDDFENILWAHFEQNTKYNITKDDVDYYLSFRPGELIQHPEIKPGSYVCIPNVDNVLEWWLIIYIDNDNELRKAHILKTNWVFKWVVNGKIYQCLGCQRYASSYNSGAFEMDRITVTENMNGIWLPTNSDSDTLSYNQRLIISAGNRAVPICWEITKCETTIPVGISKFTVSQSEFDPEHDNVELMLANYYDVGAGPVISETDPEVASTVSITYNGTKPTIKIGGSYRVFTPIFSNSSATVQQWTVSDQNGNISANTNYTIEYLNDQLKLKAALNYDLIGTVLTVKVVGTDGSTAEISAEVV